MSCQTDTNKSVVYPTSLVPVCMFQKIRLLITSFITTISGQLLSVLMFQRNGTDEILLKKDLGFSLLSTPHTQRYRKLTNIYNIYF